MKMNTYVRYFYVINGDGTTRDGFKPFSGPDPNYAEAPDWIDDDRACGNALHVVSENPAKALEVVTRNKPVAYEVEPIDLKPGRGDKYRCRALRKIRQLPDKEFVDYFMKQSFVDINTVFDNEWITCLDACIKAGIMPTAREANWASAYGYLSCLNKCIEAGVNPTSDGTDWAAAAGHLNCLNRCIEVGVKPTSSGADWAAENGRLNCLNRCIEIGIKPTSYGANQAAENGYLDCLKRCIEVGVKSTTYSDAARF